MLEIVYFYVEHPVWPLDSHSQSKIKVSISTSVEYQITRYPKATATLCLAKLYKWECQKINGKVQWIGLIFGTNHI